MRLLSSAVSPTRPPRALRPRGPAGHARAAAPGPGRPATSAGAGPDAEEADRHAPRLDALLERALARMAHTLAEGGEARAAAASHAGPEQGEDEAREDAPAASDEAAAGPAAAAPLAGGLGWTYAAAAGDGMRLLTAVLERCRGLGQVEWKGHEELEHAVRAPLVRLAFAYVAEQKAAPGTARAADSVANFHLRNGARLERINWNADPSAKGWERSYGIMVNYGYAAKGDAAATEERAQRYAGGEVVVAEALRRELAR